MASLTINQRNLYLHFLNHKEKGLTTPCYVPPIPSQNSRLHQYLRALERLEELHLVIVDRESPLYTEWVIHDPEDPINVRSPGRIRSIPDPLWQSARPQRPVAS